MTVFVRTLSLSAFGGGSGGLRQWEDDFPDATIAAFAATGRYNFLGTTTRALSVAANRFTFGAGAGGTPMFLMVPNQLGGAYSRPQFSRFIYAANTGTDANPTRPSAAVFSSGLDSSNNNFLSAYVAVIRNNPAAADLQLIRNTSWVSPAGSVLLATFALPSVGDDVMITGDIDSNDDPVLSIFYNGVQSGSSVTDVGGFTAGLPGFGSRVDSPATSYGIENYRAGIL